MGCDMSLWDKLKSGFNHPTPTENAPSANVHIYQPTSEKKIEYDPELIEKLHAEHQELVVLAAHIEYAVKHDDLKSAAAYLETFKKQLVSHLYTENIKLYLYLQHFLHDNSDDYRQMRRLRKEMDAIGNTVTQCITKYQHIDQHPELKEAFLKDLAEVIPILKSRIRVEESQLYAMYTASH